MRNPRASPSGHLEQDESVIDGAIREASEEVGVTIDPSDLAFVHVVHYRAPGSEGRHDPAPAVTTAPPGPHRQGLSMPYR
ncbi:MAG TPA: NUDIX domain-containing protein [Trebonia sp.]